MRLDAQWGHAWSCGACHPSTFADVADFRFRVHDSRLSRGGRARAGSEQTDPWDNGRGQGLRRWKFFRHVVARPAFRVLHVPVSDDPVLRRHMHPQGARSPRGGTTGTGAGEGAGAIGNRGRYTGSSATRICWLHQRRMYTYQLPPLQEGRGTACDASTPRHTRMHVCMDENVCERIHVHTYACVNVHTTAHSDASVTCPHHVHTAPSPAIKDAFLKWRCAAGIRDWEETLTSSYFPKMFSRKSSAISTLGTRGS